MGRSIYEVPHNDNVPHILEGKDLKTLLVASIQTLKHNSKKCGKEVFQPFCEIKTSGTRTCLTLPKLNQDSNSKESVDETLASNNTLALCEYEELIKFKNSIIDEFDALKSTLLKTNI